MEFHPVCAVFDMMEGEEFKALVSDIREHGLIEPILTYQGKIIDGRNRYQACIHTGIEPRFQEWKGDESLFSLVVSLNLHRRHLGPISKSSVLKKVCEERGVRMGKGGDRKSTATVAVDTAESVAESLGMKPRTARYYIALSKELEDFPDLAKKVDSSEMPINKAKKEARKRRREVDLEANQSIVGKQKKEILSSVCDLRVCSCSDLFKSGIKPDAVITDPPYPSEFLPVFTELAEGCKATGVPMVAVMIGQSYLPEVLSRLCKHLSYRWTIAYLTPGGQSVQQFPMKVNCFWKPVLIFGDPVEWFGDVAKSKVNDNDKRFHDWGQSESGIADLVERLTKPGQLICDPFLGGGTTAVVSLALGRRFVGCDIASSNIDQTKERVMK